MTTSSKLGWGSHKRICKRVYNKKLVKQESKNIFIKMLKDVGMIVPKHRETSAVYMQQYTRTGQYICSKTGDEGMQQY